LIEYVDKITNTLGRADVCAITAAKSRLAGGSGTLQRQGKG
jgi:hypothetical protein